MKESQFTEPQEKVKSDPQVDLLRKESALPKETEKLTLKTILSYFYSSSGRTVATFGLGVVAGILVITLFFSNSFQDTGSVSGTMGGLDNYENFEVADYVQINTTSANGHIAVQYRDEMVITQVNLNSADNVKMTLSFNPDNLKVYSVKPVHVNDESSFNSGRNFINLNNKGESRYMILFRNNLNKDQIQVKITSESGEVNNYSVRTRAN